MAKAKAEKGTGQILQIVAGKPMSDKQQMKDHARRQKRHATESWVSGHMNTAEHDAIHARADHVLSGKRPGEFKGKTGDRKIKGL